MSKRIRFSVFKRDSFACRYCGASAPNVQLQIDHVVSVSDGGSDDPSNLVTACAACNFGKGARSLNDDDLAALRERGPAEGAQLRPDDVQADPGEDADPIHPDDQTTDAAAGFASRREQAQAIEERRNQLEMMIEWREEIISLHDEAVDALDRRIVARTGFAMNEEYRQRMRRWVRHHGLAAIFEALEDALDQMLEWRDGVVMIASWERAFAAIPQIIELRQVARDKPHFRELLYVCGLLRRRLPYVNELRCLRLLEDGVTAGASIEAMKAFARTVKSWTVFRRGLEEFINDYGGPDDVISGDPISDPPAPGDDPARADPADTPGSAGKAGPAEGPHGSDPPVLREAPFEKRRPLRHFAAEGPPDQGGGGREIAGTGTRYRSS